MCRKEAIGVEAKAVITNLSFMLIAELHHYLSIIKFKESKPEKEANDITASNQTESTPVTQENVNHTIQDQTNTQTQSPFDDQAATLADQTNQAQATTTAQATAAVPEAATASASTQADAITTATTQPDASATQAAAYTNSKLHCLLGYLVF